MNNNEVKKYYELDNPSRREIKEFSCLEELMEKLLSDSLL
jgi:hypothetical protein